MTAPYRGLYINLDRSPERRKKFEGQLARLHLTDRYTRFPAVDGKNVTLPNTTLSPGEVGVFLSHCQALESVRGCDTCVHVLEDDALLSEHVAPVLEDVATGKIFERYDLLFTDMMVHCHIGFMKNLKTHFDAVVGKPGPLRLKDLRLFDLSQVFFAAFQSYIVAPKAIDRVIALYRDEIAKGITTPVDNFIQQQVLAGKLKAACLFPFITSFRLEDVVPSTIADNNERAGQPSIMVMAVLRHLFFTNCDLDFAKRVLDAATAKTFAATDPRRALMAQACEFALSDDLVERGMPP